MDIIRLRQSDGTWERFKNDWLAQCEQNEEELESYSSTLSVIETFATRDFNNEWAIAIYDGERHLATACAIRTMQKGLNGWTLRIREVTVCPLVDCGSLDEDVYIDTLSEILNGAIKLSENALMARNIRLHLRSPSDFVFFRMFLRDITSKGVFESTESHGAWLTLVKPSSLEIVK